MPYFAAYDMLRPHLYIASSRRTEFKMHLVQERDSKFFGTLMKAYLHQFNVDCLP